MIYPTLRIGVLQSMLELKAQWEQDQAILSRPDCPYDKDTIMALTSIFQKVEVEKVVEKVVERGGGGVGRPRNEHRLSEEDEQSITDTATELLTQLKTLGDDTPGLDPQTQIQIIKAKASLIEQVTKIRERWFNIKRMSLFNNVVVGILDDLVGEDQRAEFLKRIEPYRE